MVCFFVVWVVCRPGLHVSMHTHLHALQHDIQTVKDAVQAVVPHHQEHVPCK